jgi:hypothetical protein
MFVRVTASELPVRAGWWRQELYIALMIVVAAWIGCRWYLPAFRAAGGRGMSYYDEFGPAVMAACGRGFTNPVSRSIPALDTFLLEGTASFDCRSLGERPPVIAIDDFQSATRNLLFAAAVIWRVAGISWKALDSLAATMFAVSLAAAYLVMRFVIGRPLALIGTFLWAISPMHLANVPHLRDYSKAPFFALTALAMALAIRSEKPRTLIALGAVFGFVQGIGFGMRTDVGLNFAPFFLVLFVLGSGALNRNLRSKGVAAGVTLFVFAVTAWPVLNGYRHTEGLWHVSLLGLTTPFDNALNLRRAPYDFGYLYDDSYMSTVIHAYWYRVHDAAQVSLHNSGLYDEACKEYYRLLLSTFPGDFLTRMAGSALHVLNLPFSISYGIVPIGITNAVATWLSEVRAWIMLAFAGAGPMIAVLLLTLIGMRDRIAVCVAFVVLAFWSTYPYLQFHGRHVFHLEMLVIVIVLWTAALSVRTFRDVYATREWKDAGRRGLQSLAVIAAFICVAIAGIGTARLVQGPRVRAMLGRYADAAVERLDVEHVTEGDRLVRLSPLVFEPADTRARIQQAMLVLEITSLCDLREVPVHVRYEALGTGELDFSRDLTVAAPVHAGASRVFLPVYSIEQADGRLSRFVGVDVPTSSATCVRISRARELEHEPLLLNATLPEDWQSQPVYQPLYIGPLIPERVWLRVARRWPRVAELG